MHDLLQEWRSFAEDWTAQNPTLYECTLVWLDKLLHERCHHGSENFGDQFTEVVEKTYQPIVLDFLRGRILLKKDCV
jgi:hypothetical protein